MITEEVINSLKTNTNLLNYLNSHQDANPSYQSVIDTYDYKQELLPLQAKLVNFQRWV
ncbi:hypothetical protein [Psychroserpens burtonensis]|uniref:hypothetical protein n=1 Tax=Psychroserpens burtonensis TaxID=49278 RepID=UPI00164B664D|nr:hypothetical protein [Psychroserpens burtonensis]